MGKYALLFKTLGSKQQWNFYHRQNGVGTISAALTTCNGWHSKLHFVSCAKRRQADLLRFGKKRETLNPWSGHGGEAGSICFWNFNSMLVLGSICFAEFPRAKFRLPTALSIIWQNSTNVSTTTCVLVRRDYVQKRVNAKYSVFISGSFFAQLVWYQVTKWNLMTYFPGKRR